MGRLRKLGFATALAALLAVTSGAAAPPPGRAKVESRLGALAWGDPPVPPVGRLVARSVLDPALGGRARVYVRLDGARAGALAALRARGLEVERDGGDRVQGLVDPRRVPDLAALARVRSIRPVLPGVSRAGSVTSEGDVAARADLVRAAGFTGAGVRVGVISDGISHRASAQATGDLPLVTVPVDPRCGTGSGDEGTAILEIVHDLVPGAQLLFSEGISSSLAFIDSIDCLRAAGADVIVDDIGFFDEPYFADGPVAIAVRAAVAAGVSFHSAAGNDADRHYEGPYVAAFSSTLRDFAGGDAFNAITVPPDGSLACILQWNDPFGGSSNDYDLLIFDDELNPVPGAGGTDVQSGTQDPIEIVQVINFGGTSTVGQLAIDRNPGAAPRELELFCLGGSGMERTTAGGSIIGHPALPEVVAVGAIDALDPGLDDVEEFSSRGPARVFFPFLASRAKPDVAGFDGVSTTNPGGFPQCPPFCDFFGTSAAAPHTAAVAALLLDKNPFLFPATILDVLRTSAVDVGPAGFDAAAGAGRVDAFAAAAAVAVPECVQGSDCPTDADPCTTATCIAGSCSQGPVTCDDGDRCNGDESCEPGVGCVAGAPLVCEGADPDPCTIDTCAASTGCVHTEVAGIGYVECALAQRLRPIVPPAESALTRRAARSLRRIARKLDRAEVRVGEAMSVSGPSARRKLGRARTLVRAISGIASARRSALPSDVAQSIVREADRIADRIAVLRLFL